MGRGIESNSHLSIQGPSTTSKATQSGIANPLVPFEAGFRLRLSKPQGNETYRYTPDQVVAMLELCDSVQSLNWLESIIQVLACTGLRISELFSLRRTDIDFENDLIRLKDERSSQRRNEMGQRAERKGDVIEHFLCTQTSNRSSKRCLFKAMAALCRGLKEVRLTSTAQERNLFEVLSIHFQSNSRPRLARSASNMLVSIASDITLFHRHLSVEPPKRKLWNGSGTAIPRRWQFIAIYETKTRSEECDKSISSDQL